MQETNESISRPEIALADLKIGDGHPCLVIPECGEGHMGSLSRAKEMADACKSAGAKIIKWQMHLPEEEMVKDEAIAASRTMLVQWGSIWDYETKFTLSAEEHYQLKQYCDKIGIQYFCTPFSLRAARILNEMAVHGFKIGSGETEDLLMLEEIAKMRKPLIVSTGMTAVEEIDLTVQALREANAAFALAHCVSIYSGQRANQLDYGVIPYLKKRYNVPVGLSDHTPPDPIKAGQGDSLVSHEARIWAVVHQGANFIEKHFTLDRGQPDADSCFSLNPKGLETLIQTVRIAQSAISSEKKIFKEEEGVIQWAKRSLVAAVDIPVGEVLERAMLTSKRPGTGIRSRDYKKALGRKTKVFIPRGALIKWANIED